MLNDVVTGTGTLAVGEAAGFILIAESPPKGLSGWVSWARPGKIVKANNLTVRITTPDGLKFVFDDPYPQGSQSFNESWDQVGSYAIVIENTGANSVKYRAEMVVFG